MLDLSLAEDQSAAMTWLLPCMQPNVMKLCFSATAGRLFHGFDRPTGT